MFICKKSKFLLNIFLAKYAVSSTYGHKSCIKVKLHDLKDVRFYQHQIQTREDRAKEILLDIKTLQVMQERQENNFGIIC